MTKKEHFNCLKQVLKEFLEKSIGNSLENRWRYLGWDSPETSEKIPRGFSGKILTEISEGITQEFTGRTPTGIPKAIPREIYVNLSGSSPINPWSHFRWNSYCTLRRNPEKNS